MNINLLKSKIIENGYTQKTLANKMDISVNTLNKKILLQSAFTVGDLKKLKKLLDLSTDDVNNIFFNK